MVWCALLGCISSCGGFIADEAGVEGAGAGEDGTALVLFFLVFLFSSCGSRSGNSASSVTAVKVGAAGLVCKTLLDDLPPKK